MDIKRIVVEKKLVVLVIGVLCICFVWVALKLYFNKSATPVDKKTQTYNNAAKRILQIAPKSAQDYKVRGDILSTQDNYDQAIVEYNKAIEIYPNEYTFYMGRGMAFLRKNDLDYAISDFSRVIGIKPDLAEAYFFRGSAYFMKREPGEYKISWEDLFKAKSLGYSGADKLIGEIEKIVIDNIGLEGIFSAAGKNSALINGKIFKEGEDTVGVKVIKINNNSVTFQYGDKIIEKKVGEGVKVATIATSSGPRTDNSYRDVKDYGKCFIAQDFVRARLKNPRGARFSECKDGIVRIYEDGECVAGGWVEATNSFGATIRTPYAVTMRCGASECNLISIDMQD